ncbi:MAG TPA: MBL fold metallo-hydrolase [Puia sp.]|nr:MBL fold metallo-hydrolase [Puia sp.]
MPTKKTSSKALLPLAPSGKIDNVSIRMYCLGTGDCFLVKFRSGALDAFTMMIDCGSCRGDKNDFMPYVQNLADSLTNKTIDLLVVTHEHNDHVNGFDKCYDIFNTLTIKEAWFAWTEDPNDPTGAAAALKQKQSKIKEGLRKAMTAIKANQDALLSSNAHNAYKPRLEATNDAFLNGLDTLAAINLSDTDTAGESAANTSLPGMRKIKQLLQDKGVKIRYLGPGNSFPLSELPGVVFHVLGPPAKRDAIFKDGKEGTDVYNKTMALNDSMMAVNALLSMSEEINPADLPFSSIYIEETPNDKAAKKPPYYGFASIVKEAETAAAPVGKSSDNVINDYRSPANEWRGIDDDWLNSIGALALRLNSHINNTSLALAIEFTGSGKVLLFPGDAEYGSWESWHLIPEWMTKGKDGKPWAEDLLNRTVFYKVGHHLSYNGTALEKGILMMNTPALVAMATLDRHRIAKGWTSTMPNKYLLQELIKRTQGKLFIMDEFEVPDPPSTRLDPATLGKDVYVAFADTGSPRVLYKQYTITGL